MTTTKSTAQRRLSSDHLDEGAAIVIKDLSHSFMDRHGELKPALRDVSFEIPRSRFAAIVGPSGCGKSTLLNLISGLVKPTEGSIAVEGAPVTGVRNDIGYMPSSDTLLPWRTVRNNVAYPLEFTNLSKAERLDRAAGLLDSVGLSKDAWDQYPHALSQGMRQRVAIARTFAARSDIILMDEPFSALDAQTRLRVQDLFLSIWDREKPTVVLITHDVSEAVALADQVVVFTKGPGTVERVIDVGLSRPRSVENLLFESTEFQDHMRDIWTSLRAEEPNE